jgi:hypothetical protein
VLVVAPMFAGPRLGAGAGVGVRPAAAAEGQGQAPDHLGDGHGDGRGQREVDGHADLAAEVTVACAGGLADADAPAVRRAVVHVAAGGEGGAGGRVEQRRHDGAEERQEHARLLVLALLPHAQEHRDRAQERGHGVRDHQEPACNKQDIRVTITTVRTVCRVGINACVLVLIWCNAYTKGA